MLGSRYATGCGLEATGRWERQLESGWLAVCRGKSENSHEKHSLNGEWRPGLVVADSWTDRRSSRTERVIRASG